MRCNVTGSTQFPHPPRSYDCGLTLITNMSNYTKHDLCGICGGDSSSCFGCDGVKSQAPARFDACGKCGGDNSTCCPTNCYGRGGCISANVATAYCLCNSNTQGNECELSSVSRKERVTAPAASPLAAHEKCSGAHASVDQLFLAHMPTPPPHTHTHTHHQQANKSYLLPRS